MTDVFPLVPASSKPLWVIGGICLLMLALLGLLLYLAYAARHARVAVTADHLQLDAAFYGRTLPLSALRLDEAAVVDLATAPAYAPALRTNGIGLPGYRAGWFKLRNGQKALTFVTNPGAVLYLPTTQGYALLLSAATPERLLATLRARTG